MDDDTLYPFSTQVWISAPSDKKSRLIQDWFVSSGLERDIDYEVHFVLDSRNYIFDSRNHAVMFKLLFGGNTVEE